MGPYLAVLLSSFLVDCIPVFAPPAWMLMMFFMIRYQLDPYTVAFIGTIGTVCGRLVYVTYIVPWVGTKTIGPKKEADLRFVGDHLSKRGKSTLFFVFIYSLLPLSTTVLFTAAGLAKVKRRFVVPAFFMGNWIGDTVILVTGNYAVLHFSDVFQSSFDTKSIAGGSFALLVVLLFLFIDWRQLLESKKFRLKFQFWR